MRDPTYDAAVLQKAARRLYAMARGIVFQWTVGLGSVFLLAEYGAQRTHIVVSQDPTSANVLAGVLGGVLGLVIGLDRSLMLRAQAQVAIAIANIEAHVRGR